MTGKIKKEMEIHRDITAGKPTEGAVRKSEQRYCDLFNYSNDAILIHDMEGNIIEVNQKALSLFGYEADEILSMKVPALHPPEELGASKNAFDTIKLEGAVSFTVNFRRKNGSVFPAEVSSRLFETDDGKVIQGVVHDMTSHQKAEDELKRLNSFLSMLVESMPASIYTCRAEGDFGATYISGNIESLTGYTPEEFTSISSFWSDRIHPDDRQRVFNNLPLLFEKGHHEHEYRWRIADGSYKWFYDMLKLIKGPDGKTSHIVGTFVDITARKKAEREIVIARREWENIFQAIGHPVIILDPDHNIIAANRAAVQVTGSAPEELAGKKCYEMYHGSGSPHQCCPMDRMLLSGSLETEEMEMEALNGIYLVSCTPVMDDEGKLEKIIHIATDITDRKRSEEKIRESGEKFKSIFNNSNDGILIADIESRKFLMANRKILEMLGYPEEELLQMGIFDIHPEDSLPYVISEFEKQAAGEKTLAEKVPIKEKEGKVFYCDISSYPLELDGGKCMVGVFRDITERMHAEEEYRTIIKTSMDGFWAVDTEGNIVDTNEAYCRISGYSREELLHMNVRDIDLRESPEEIRSHIRKVMTEGSDRFETSHRARDGRSIELEISSYYSGHKGGRFYAFMRDITEKKRLEAQLMHAQKMEAVGQLAGVVAHDFNNILTAVTGYARLLRFRSGDNEQVNHYIEQINFVSGRGADLVRSLLTFSRKQEIVLRPVDLNTAVLNAEKIVNKLIGEKIELHMRLHEKDLFVLADGGQLEQVLMNLATNARDAMPDGGVLAIETGTLEIDNAYIRDHGYGAPGMHAAITVTDTGEGMGADLLKKIFDPFFTTKGPEKGTGLGLAISYSIIKQHNGHINVYSEPGRGTSFKIYLPVIEKADDLTASQWPAELRGGTETILLAEDDMKVRRALREILEEYGYSVIEAADGDAAVRKFSEKRDMVRLAILDMVMPVKGGKEAYEEMKGMGPGVKALFMSGYTEMAMPSMGIDTDGTGFISKPFSPDILLKKIREVLAG